MHAPGGRTTYWLTCAECGDAFDTIDPKRRFCSSPCANRNKGAAQRITRVCIQCGSLFRPANRGSKQITSGAAQKYCSQKCWADDRTAEARLKNARIELLRVLTSRSVCEFCAATFVGHGRWCSSSCWYRDHKGHLEALPCKRCGITFIPNMRGRLFCSDRCLRRAHHGPPDNHRKRARKAGVLYQPVNRLKVFDRDGWKCQVCGRNTPKRLIGTVDARAPELDHRIPFALKGDHTYANVQLACRQCNAAKHDHTIRGQMSLFFDPVAA